mgnify:CR=1 FL=1
MNRSTHTAGLTDRARAAAVRAVRHLTSALRTDGPILVLSLLLIALGCGLRVYHLDQPGHLTFDEHHFVKNARNYLAGKPDWNDHPSLGKLLIAGAMWAIGDNGTGWRLTALIFGLLSIALGYAIGATLFRRPLAGWLAAAFIAADGFFIAYSRTALLDGLLAALMMASVLVMARAGSARAIAGAALLAGLACSIKVSGIVLVLPLVLVLLLWRRAPWWSLVFLVLIPLVYYSQYALGFALTGEPYGPVDTWNKTQQLVRHHLRMSSMTNPVSSRWYTWFFPTTPITLRADYSDRLWVRMMTSMGNPLLWWAANLTVLGSAAAWLLVMIRRLRRTPGRSALDAGAAGFVSGYPRVVFFLLACWLAPVTPWIVTNRDSYVYHYLPSYGFALILVAGLVAWVYRRRRRLALLAVLLVAEVTVYYAPVWSELPVTRQGIKDRLPFRGWR